MCRKVLLSELITQVKELHQKVNDKCAGCSAASTDITEKRELGSAQMAALNAACRRALTEGAYDVRAYFGVRESRAILTGSWLDDAPEASVAVVKSYFGNDQVFDAMLKSHEAPCNERNVR